MGLTHELTLRDGTVFTLSDICKRIRDAESAVGNSNADSTLLSRRNRVPEYRSDAARVVLREQIVTELIALDRLDADEDIAFGTGGAKPQGGMPQAGATAYLVTGLPASGKSTLVSTISDRCGAMILDSDFAKRKLPEFDHTLAGANLVHKESSTIVFGSAADEPSLLGYCKSEKLNIVIPQIGHNEKDLKDMRDSLIAAGYKVHLTITLLDRIDATKRALARFLETGRYVPLALIFDGYANDPIMNYYKACMDATLHRDHAWESFGALATDVFPARVDWFSSVLNPAALMEQTA
ncbi:MAG: zeta toxin family protein [Pseudomonadota bacterium]